MKNRKWANTLTFLVLLSASLAAAAQEVSFTGCRRGTPRPQQTLRRTTQQTRQPGGDFYQGQRRQLVVLAAFQDRQFTGDEAATMAQWNDIFNTEGYQGAGCVGSVHDYFYDQSYGRFDLVFDLQYVQLPNDCVKYRSTQADDENSQYLVDDVVDILEQRNIDWSPYDWNGDGYVNQLIILFAGKSMHDSGGQQNTIWAHQWWLSEHQKNRKSGVWCEPRTVNNNTDGKAYKIDCYCALAELSGRGDYGSFGVICHEYTHCFGFPDFYHSTDGSFVHAWDLMDFGNNNGNGFRPCGYSAHERWLMGWLTPVELTSATTVAGIPALSEQPIAYLISNDNHPEEYYMVENRQQQRWDADLPGSGILVFHIDYDPAIWISVEAWANTRSYKHYSIFPANNKTSVYSESGWSYPYQDNNMLTNESSPASTLNYANTDGTKLMGKPLTNMAVSADGLASFQFSTIPSTAISLPSEHARQSELLYRYGSLHIIRMTNGEIKKVMKH